VFPKALLCVAIILVSLGTAAAQDLDARGAQEIDHLLRFIEASDCRFQRNGSWYGGAEAAAHLERKYRYTRDKGLIRQAEDFIVRVATQSSLSGRNYQVQCNGATAIDHAAWLSRELKAFRSQTR
jgi:hypothetical protein